VLFALAVRVDNTVLTISDCNDLLCCYFTELRHNTLLGELLHMVLATGNYLNAVGIIWASAVA